MNTERICNMYFRQLEDERKNQEKSEQRRKKENSK